jgi:putative nucleotidyltransferase with HDIG domain
MPFVNSKNAFILIDDFSIGAANNKSIFRGIGKYGVDIEGFMSLLEPALIEDIGYARITKQTVHTKDGAVFPLINEYMQSIGVIYVESMDFEEGMKLLEIYASQAASSLNNAFLHSLVNIKNEELSRTYNELKISYMDTVEALRLAVDAKDVYTRGHSDRVAYFAVKIGKAFDLSESDLEILRISGIFHDIGKIGTADDILLKTDRLNFTEYGVIKKHPLKGAHILSAVSMFRDVVPLVKFHHERMDGRGYPQGLKGEEIPFLARILSVADAFDAMTSDRQYRSKLDLNEAKQQLIEGKGTQFDKAVVEKLISLLDHSKEMVSEVACTYDANPL